MRQLSIILLVLLTTLLGCKSNHLNRINIDPDLRFIVEEWVNTCEENNIEYEDYLANVDSIVYDKTMYLDKIGEYNNHHRIVRLNYQIKKEDYYFKRLVIYHEMGHVLRLNHICGHMSIMNPYLSHDHVKDYNLWWDELLTHYYTDTVKCNKYTITKDAVISWIDEYESYCGYSNSTIGPR